MTDIGKRILNSYQEAKHDLDGCHRQSPVISSTHSAVIRNPGHHYLTARLVQGNKLMRMIMKYILLMNEMTHVISVERCLNVHGDASCCKPLIFLSSFSLLLITTFQMVMKMEKWNASYLS